MLSDILKFSDILRQAGVIVSISEVMDFIDAVALLGIEKEAFLWAMEAALVKNENHRDTLYRLFDLYWSSENEFFFAGGEGIDPENAPKLERDEFQRRLEAIKNDIRNEKMLSAENIHGNSPSEGRRCSGLGRSSRQVDRSNAEIFISLILGGDRERMRSVIRGSLENIKETRCESDMRREIKISTGWAEGEELLKKMAAGGFALQLQIDENLNLFRNIMEKEIDRLFWEKEPERVLKRLNTSEVHFNSIDYDKALEIKRKLVMLGKRIATRKGYRYAASSSGSVDLRKTAALAGMHGGIPVKLLMRKRKPTRPEIVILCDLSGSVASFSRFMLLLVSAMQDKFRIVRSFAFVDGVEEITGIIRGWDAEKKISEILRVTEIWQTGFSDYGAVWNKFEEKFAGFINDKTTLIILGDARNNYKPDGIDHFASIAGRARRTIWLNPAPASSWDTEDSIISRYGRFCDSVMECRNMAQLEKVARRTFI